MATMRLFDRFSLSAGPALFAFAALLAAGCFDNEPGSENGLARGRSAAGKPAAWTAFSRTEVVTNNLKVLEITTSGQRSGDAERGLSSVTNFIGIVRPAKSPEALRRLSVEPQVITSVLSAEGLCSARKWGASVSARFHYSAVVKAESVIDIDTVKVETGSGRFHVTEKRKFTQVFDSVSVEKTDVGLAVRETLPVESLFSVVETACALAEPFLPGSLAAAGSAALVVGEGLDAVDGKTLRDALSILGVEVPAGVEEAVKEYSGKYVNGQLENFKSRVRAINGKTFRIDYLQAPDGLPLRVEFANEDGSPIIEEELEILKLANIFLDFQLIPDTRVKRGDTWKVEAEALSGMIDTFVNGACVGDISVTRRDDLPGGNWNLKINPARVKTVSDDGSVTGDFQIDGGCAECDASDPAGVYIKAMQFTGRGRLGKVESERALIFDLVEKSDGECTFNALLTSERK